MAFIAKFAAVFLLFTVTFLFGVTPSLVLNNISKSSDRAKTYVGYLNCVAGGIFFGTALLHLLPNSIQQIEEFVNIQQFPLALTLVGVGFFLLLIIEHVIGSCHRHGHGHSHQDAYDRLDDPSKEADISSKSHDSKGHLNGGDALQMTDKDSVQKNGVNNKYGAVTDDSTQTTEDKNNANGDEKDCETLFRMKTVVLLIALSLHMIFEGLATGLQKTESEVWTLLSVIMLHKCMIAFSIGLQIWTFRKMKLIILAAVGFSVVAPVGIIIGAAVSEVNGEGRAQGVTSGVLQSLTTRDFPVHNVL